MHEHPIRINWVMPRASLGGGTKSSRLIAEAMVRRGHDVRIAYVDAPPELPPPWRVRTFVKKYIRRRKWRTQKHHLMQSTAQLIPVPRTRIEADDLPDADVLIASWWETMEWVKDWPASKGMLVHYVRGHEVFKESMRDRVEDVYRLPCPKVTISSWLKRILADEYGFQDAEVIPNGIDWQQFDSQPRDKQPVPTVGLTYGCMKQKGAASAFEAVRLVQQEIPELCMIAFGQAPIRDDHHPPANFEFHLQPAQSLIPQLYRSTDCWLMASWSEGLGMPGLEAEACRCPLVCARSGGPEDYMEEGVNGYLVEPDEPRQMADRILKVVRQSNADWRKMSEASYRIAQAFDWDKSAAKLETYLYKQLSHPSASLMERSVTS